MKILISFKLYFFLFLHLVMYCHTQEIYDVETLPNLRTTQYALGPYKKIIIFSASRTGSSLVYNVFRFLFEDDSKLFAFHNAFNLDRLVLKTHRFAELDLVEKDKDNVLCIFTFRNPLEASISNYRICLRKFLDKRAFAEELINRHRRYLLFSEKMEKDGWNVLRLKYENFANDQNYLFDVIENHFFLSIDTRDKELMNKGYSKENIYSCICKFADFSEYLPISGFHGKHVILENYAPPADFLHWLNVYLEDVKYIFQTYGYF